MVAIDRNTTNRVITGSRFVLYDEAAALTWLAGPHPDNEDVTVADGHEIDHTWPSAADGDRLTYVLSLIETAIAQKVVTVDPETIERVGYERTADSSGELDGARLLVTTTTGLTLAGDPVWSSELLDDQLGAKGALSALWNTAWEIHYLMEKLADWPLSNVFIAPATNPWVQVEGAPFDWSDPAKRPVSAANECTGCVGSPVPGAIPAMDTDEGIQRCDECELFDGDLEAAAALAKLVGGSVHFTAKLK